MAGRSQRPPWLGEDHRGWDHVRVHLAVLRDERLDAYAMSVYLGLAAHAELREGIARPSVATLAGYGRMSVRKAQYSIQLLADCGWIEVVEQAGEASQYRLLPPPRDAHDAGVGVHEVREGVHVMRAGGAPDAPEQEPVNENQERESVPVVAREQLDEARRLCELLADSLRRRGERLPDRPSARWVLGMEQLLRLDERTPGQVEWVIRWLDAGADEVSSFWRANVRSPRTLRARWAQMADQYRRLQDRPGRGQLPGLSIEAQQLVADHYAEGR